MRFFPRKPRTFLFVCTISLILVAIVYNQRDWLAHSMYKITLHSFAENWSWYALSQGIAWFTVALFTVFFYHVLTYQTPETKVDELMRQMDGQSAQMEALKIAVDQLRSVMPQSTPLELLPELEASQY
jgi:hypothetical protein